MSPPRRQADGRRFSVRWSGPCRPEALLKSARRKIVGFALLAIALALVAAFLVRQWQGPQLAAYRIESHPLVQTVVATGRVVSASRAQVGSQITGVLVERRVREGDVVQQGDVLAVLRADDLDARVQEAEAALAQLRESTRPQAEAALRQAQAQLAQASREASRRRDLFQRQLIAREPMEQAVQAETVARTAAEQARLAADALASGRSNEVQAQQRLAAARAALEKTFVRAQVAGTVLTRDAEPGDLVQPGRVLFEIAREGQTELLVPLDEKNLEVLALDQQASCVADAYPSRPFPATVSFIAPAVDPQRGSVDVRLALAPVPGFLRQDMTVSVNIETGRRERALVVPNDALLDVEGSRGHVWKVSDGKAARTAVTLGLRGLALTEVTEGLAEGDLVLADPAPELVDGDRVRITREALPASGVDTRTRGELPVQLN